MNSKELPSKISINKLTTVITKEVAEKYKKWAHDLPTDYHKALDHKIYLSKDSGIFLYYDEKESYVHIYFFDDDDESGCGAEYGKFAVGEVNSTYKIIFDLLYPETITLGDEGYRFADNFGIFQTLNEAIGTNFIID